MVSTPSATAPSGAFRLGRLMGVPVFVSYSWFIVAAFIAVAFAPAVEQVTPGLGTGKYVVGVAIAALLYLAILIHEWAHARVGTHYGLRVESITLHMLGGVTVMNGEPDTPRKAFWIAVVGPIASLGVGALAYAAGAVVPEGLPALGLRALAVTNLFVGVFNLLPGMPLDGGQILKASWWAATGNQHRGTIVAAWGGRLVSLLPLVYLAWLAGNGARVGFVTLALYLAITAVLWQGASAGLQRARLLEQLPRLQLNALMRPLAVMPPETTYDAALAEVSTTGQAIAVRDHEGGVAGLVRPREVALVPPAERAGRPLGSLLGETTAPRLLAGLGGEALLLAVRRAPSDVHLVVDADGSPVGALLDSDLEAAFRKIVGR